jgi:uncharacterized protein (TIGR02284 family)
MDNEKSIEVLNSLIVINNDRVEGYKTASNETKDSDLKSLFAQFEQTSKKNRDELATEVTKLGATPDEGTRTTGKFFRVWMDVKVALSKNDRKVILDSCEYGEKVAAETYADVLENEIENLTEAQQKMLQAQHALLIADCKKVENLKASL